jgi:hypothetical protein
LKFDHITLRIIFQHTDGKISNKDIKITITSKASLAFVPFNIKIKIDSLYAFRY